MTSNGDVNVMDPFVEELPAPPKAGKKGKLSVERIYQKKTQLEHILLRPDTYIGSVEKLTQAMWVYDPETESMVHKEITFVPGLYKIYDEILVNAADNKQRDPNMNCIRIDIKPEENMIKIWNNGKGIPVVEHKEEKMFVPTMIFGHLLTSSNYDDTEKKVTGGRNGYGAKLCNIFSTKFIVETSCKEFGKALKQTWINNMTKTSDPRIHPADSEDFTSITFYPDLPKFKMESLDRDTVDLFTRRAYDLAATSHGVKIFLNGQRLGIKNFKDYVQLYLKDKTDDAGNPLKVVHEIVSPRWEVAVALSNTGFQQVSFVNSIATTKGGRHVDHVSDQVTNKLVEVVKKKSGAKSGVTVKKFQVLNHLWVFVNCLIENPSFDSQTKENMTLQVKSFGSKCSLSEAFYKNAQKCGIVESILNWVRFKTMEKMQDQCHKSKRTKLKGIPKLDDANLAGTKDSRKCTLILTEGDSAKALAVAGLGVVGRDTYGVFPLRGKLLNVRDASAKQVMDNVEINALIKILGLQYKIKYQDPESLLGLRYGKVMIMTDQDQDGSHIKGLIINFLHHHWPNLIQHNFVEEFITPIVKVFKGKVEHAFYSLPEFEEWKQETHNWHTWRVKYYKGLGTSSSKEAKEYFTDMARHRIRFRYSGVEDDSSLTLAFGKGNADERKDWLMKFMAERKRRQELGLAEDYLYGKDTKVISYGDFINKELILFSNMDNERSIPSIVDGFKPGQRKVLFSCFKRNLTREMKVAQLAGSVAEISAYHHGEASLASTIVGLAQNFVGSNNVNLLMPHGQFGTRLHGGKDAASPRYIFTCLSPLARLIFHPADDPLLKYNFDDNTRVEPEWYIPIIPMVLVNGADGIGTGWSTKVPNYNPRELIMNLRRMMNGDELMPMLPFYRGFTGTIEELDTCRFVVSGVCSVMDESGTVEITELPVRTWTQNYKENVIEPMHTGSEKTDKTNKAPPPLSDYKEYHTDKTVRFVVKMSEEKLMAAEDNGLHKFFKLSTNLTSNSMVLFDQNGCIHRFTSPLEIIRDFYELRLTFYEKRKQYLEGMLSAECLKLENQARFVLEKIQGSMLIENKAKRALIALLDSNGYDSDPVKKWKETLSLLADLDTNDANKDENEEDNEALDFNYILNMPLWSLTLEKKEELLKQRDKKKEELKTLRSKTPKDLWNEDLDALLAEMDKMDEQEKKEEEELLKRATKQKGQRGTGKNEFLPSPNARRVAPRLSEFAMKIEADKKKQQRKVEKAAAAAEKVFDLDDDVPPPLSERLSLSGTNVFDGLKKEPQKRQLHIMTVGETKGRGRGRGGRAAGGGTRSEKAGGGGRKKKLETSSLGGSPKKSSPKKGKGKRRNFSDSEGSEEDSDSSGAGMTAPVIGARDRAPRRAAAATAAKKYVFDVSDESDEEEIFEDIDHGQGDRGIVTEAAKESDVSDAESLPAPAKSDSPNLLDSPPEKPAPKPAPAAKPRGGGGAKPRGGGTTRGGRGRGRGGSVGAARPAKARPKKKVFDSDISDPSMSDADSDVVPKKKALLPKEPAAPKADPFAVDSDEDEEPLPLSKRLGAQRAATRVIPTYKYTDSESESEEELPAKKRKRALPESDDDFNPSKGKKGKKGSVFSDSDGDF